MKFIIDNNETLIKEGISLVSIIKLITFIRFCIIIVNKASDITNTCWDLVKSILRARVRLYVGIYTCGILFSIHNVDLFIIPSSIRTK